MSALNRSEALGTLTKASSENVQELAEAALTMLDDIQVIKNRTGLVMLPYTDSAQGTAFHLGEVLVAEAHIRSTTGEEGYGMVIGRNLVQAMALAVLDLCIASNIMIDEISAFVSKEAQKQADADTDLLKQVQATRVDMETF